MKSDSLLRMRNELAGQGVIFFYSGEVTDDVLSLIGNAAKARLMIDGVGKSTVRNVFGVLVEMAQNIMRYSDEVQVRPTPEGDVEFRSGVLTVGRSKSERHPSSLYVACGNLVSRDTVESLRGKLEHVQQLDAEELKAAYKSTLKGAVPEGSKGAGVGFIDIARKAPHGFNFDLADLGDHSFFTLTAYL